MSTEKQRRYSVENAAPLANWRCVAAQVFVAFLSSFSYMAVGLARSWASTGVPSLNNLELAPNVTNPYVLPEAPLGPDTTSWIISTLPLGALTGSFIATFPLNYLGRKPTIIISGALFVISFLLIALAEVASSVPMIIVGRVICGLGVGVASPSAPIYISEISTPAHRGTLACFPALLLAVGVLLGYAVGAALPWHHLAWFMLTIPAILCIGMIFLPESPLWLFRTKKSDSRVVSALTFLRGGCQAIVRKEFADIQDAAAKALLKETGDENNPATPPPSFFASFFCRASLYPLFLSLALMFIQIWCGVNILIFKTVDIFAAVGSSIDKYVATGIVGAVNLVATAVSVAVVDKTGRRLLLLVSCAITCIAQIILGVCFYLGKEKVNELAGWLPLACFIGAFVGYALGLAAIPFLIMGEMLPARFRSICGPASTTFNLVMMFLLLKLFNNMVATMDYHGVFWFYAAVTFAGFWFIFFLLPETKGKTLDQIEQIFAPKSQEKLDINDN